MNFNQIKPFVIATKIAHKKGLVKYDKNGSALIKIHKKTFKVPKNKQYDLTQATIFGLNERLTMSANSPKYENNLTLRDLFNKEWEIYNTALLNAKGYYLNYGYYVFFARSGELVRFANPFWHRIVSVASNSSLISDPKNQLSWSQIQNKFENSTIGIAGCSVGNSISHCICMDIRPKNLKIADKSLFKMENINRVRLSYKDMVLPNSERTNAADMLLRNKASVTAEQIYSINPFANIYIYDQGLTAENINAYFDGQKNEPKLDLIIEEVDDPRIKILLRQEARKRKIPLLMVTDVGSCIQLDICRYDLKENKLTYSKTDVELINAMENVYSNPGERKAFFNFVDSLIGPNYRQDELKKIIENKTEIPTSTIIPQLGSTINTAAGIVSEAAARILLGHTYPSRVIFNKKTFKVKMYR